MTMMLMLEFTTEFLSISLCESPLLFMAGGGGGVSVDHPHPHPPSPSPLAGAAVAAADYTYKDSTQRLMLLSPDPLNYC